MNISLFSNTPTVTVLDNRGLPVRSIAYHRHPDTPQVTDTRITYHRRDARGFLTQSTDPRLHEAGLANFTYLTSLAGEVLRTQSVDAGTSLALSDVAGRPCLTLHNISADKDDPPVTRTWQYEDASLPGRPLYVTEQVAGAPARVIERLLWADPTPEAQAHNLAGQCIRHYDTAGLVRTERIALTGVSQSVTRQLLKNADSPDTLVDWQGEDDAGLEPDAYTTQTTTDATGAVLSTQDAAGHKQRLCYDVAGQLAGSWLTLKGGTEQVIVKSLHYSAAGQKLREEHGNGVVTTYTYEPKTQRLASIKTERQGSGAKVLQDLRYAYDPVGNVLSVRNDAEATRFWRNQKVVPENTYAYDSLYQLVSATGREMADARRKGQDRDHPALIACDDATYTRYTRTYTYDRAGNLAQIRHSAPASGNSYTTDITVSERSNRAVLSSLAKDPTDVETLFNAGGQQRLLLPGQSLAWTPRGELAQVTPVKRDSGADDHERYRYDNASQRVLKTSTQQAARTTQTKNILYQPGLELRRTLSSGKVTEDVQVIAVGEAGRAQVRVLHWVAGKPTDIANDQLRYSYDDQTGSSALEVDGTGELISHEEYYPYGGTALWAARNAVEARYKTVRYSGKERDATGLYYYGYRYYQPWVGRWLSADPAGTVDGLNLYLMVRNNPVTLVDEKGLNGETRHLDSARKAARLKTGEQRKVPGSVLGFTRSQPATVHITAEPVSTDKVIDDAVLRSVPLLTDLFVPNKVRSDSATAEIVTNQNGGGILAFNALHLPLAEDKSVNALQIVHTKTMTSQRSPEMHYAYWAPQGGYVDIAAHPRQGEPELLFTPGFSGCSLVVDKMSEETLRVRHVEGSKEDAQYNDLDEAEHGMGMLGAMEFTDYGFHVTADGKVVENVTATAFMKYEEGEWRIKYQSLLLSPTIESLQTKPGGFFKADQLKAKVRHYEGRSVVKTATIPLR
ncbi:RHS repeat domain-containing protein [Pseudomonas guariconensis]|uniref:RHS repeat domain-containing protein n=1 Tax=Pseudomonas guariconensis TaxID=1288410 RepID=UPI00300C66DA